jgi:hypothetical protein
MNKTFDVFNGKAVVMFNDEKAAASALELGFPKISTMQSQGRIDIKQETDVREVFLKGCGKLTEQAVLEHYGKDAIASIKWLNDSHQGRCHVRFVSVQGFINACRESFWKMGGNRVEVLRARRSEAMSRQQSSTKK